MRDLDALSLRGEPYGVLTDDIAGAAEYLVFGAPYVTGVILPVDGGRDLT